MAPNHGLKYPKCVLVHEGWFLSISEAFGGHLVALNQQYLVKTLISQKNRFSENLDSTISTGHLEQKKWFFAIFHKQPHTQSLWKIAKNRSHLAKFGCGSGAILVILFKKMWFFSSKIRKKWKTASKIILKIINIILSTYSRIYQRIRSLKYF